ncbi:MAG: restriction endonuclease subunit S [Magnetococcales bacterium]|nr:restriction endonuclease subunit S [Magnetococcales bacterium]
MKDIDSRQRIDGELLERWRLDAVKPSLLVQEDDLLLQARGLSNTAALVPPGLGETIASAPLMVIRTDRNKLSPKYLWWFLNHPKTQARLTQSATGTTVRLISKSQMEDLELPLPSLEKQQRIAAVAKLAEREQEILEDLRNKRRTYTWEVLMRMTR